MVVTLRIKLLNMSKKGIFYIVFFVALVSIFYLVIRKYIVPHNSLSTIQSFVFRNQDGKEVTNKDVEGKVYVAEFFFTTCKGICPRMNTNMKQVYEHFKNEKDFLILSHTSDPDNDTPQQLKKYADSMGVNTNQWVFLTGRKDSLYTMARVSYLIDDPSNNLKDIKDDFLHSQHWALVNKKGEVVGIYDGLLESEIKDMTREAETLLKED